MIRLEDLAFRYPGGPLRLDVPELAVARAERVAVVGPSGSGKTALLRLVAGIVVPDAGHVLTNGVEVGALPDAERRRFRIRNVGLVFQEFELLEFLSVLDNVLLPYHLDRALPGQDAARERASELARHVGLADKLDRRPENLEIGLVVLAGLLLAGGLTVTSARYAPELLRSVFLS